MHTRLVRTQPAEKGPNYARQLGWKDPEASGGNTTQPAEKGKGVPEASGTQPNQPRRVRGVPEASGGRSDPAPASLQGE